MAMVPRSALIEKLRDLSYHYKDQTKKMTLFRRTGGGAVLIRRKEDPLSEDYVRSVLKQCGCTTEQIENFISVYRCH